jgi:LuxR family maltose regulon positive regulatory protein
MNSIESSLLTTKLYIVRPYGEPVDRRRLSATLDRIPSHRLTLISAPAGSGKTTLVASWIERTGHSVAWISLDSDDNTPARFISYLVAALRRIQPGIGASIEQALQVTPLPPVESLLTPLINELSTVAGSHLLVLEDYHVIDNGTIHEATQFLLEHLPDQVHMVITTRADIPIPLSRLRVRGQLLEIRAADLQFSADEAAEFLGRNMGLNLTDEQIAMLAQRTEGWAAGLQLAALSIQGQEDVDGFVASFTGVDRFVLDFLLEEVLGKLPADQQRVLLALSILRRFNGDLCEALTDCDDGAEILEEFERNNMFLVALDNRREWYRYHQLFSDLLQHRLRLELPQEIAGLHRRAGEWFQSQGLLEEGLEHAHASGDTDFLRALLERNWRTVLSGLTFDATQKYLATLPDNEIESSPRLSLIRAWDLLMVGRLRETEKLATAGEALIQEADDPDRQEILEQLAVLQALVASNSGDPDGAVYHCERALELVVDRSPDDPRYLWYSSRLMVNSVLGIAYELQGDFDRAERIFASVTTLSRQGGDPHSVFSSLFNEARVCMLSGRFDRLKEAADEMLAMLESRQVFVSADSDPMPHQMFAVYHFERYEMEEAIREAEEAIRLTPSYLIDQIVELKKMLVDMYTTQEMFDRAHQLMTELEGISLHDRDPRLARNIALSKARLLLRERNLAGAIDWSRGFEEELLAGTAEAAGGQHSVRSLEPVERMFYARVKLAEGSAEKAIEVLEGLLREMANGRTPFMRRVNAVVLYGVALRQASRTEEALDTLAEAVRLTAPSKLARSFAYDIGEVAPLLLRLFHTRRDVAPRDYRDQLLALCGVSPEATPPVEPSRDRREIADLTGREVEILQLMAFGYSNQKIADKLYVSVNTVKTHAANLFDKLGAHSRVDALVRAREAKILE